MINEVSRILLDEYTYFLKSISAALQNNSDISVVAILMTCFRQLSLYLLQSAPFLILFNRDILSCQIYFVVTVM